MTKTPTDAGMTPLTDAITELQTQASEYAEMGCDFPTHGAGNLCEQLADLLTLAQGQAAPAPVARPTVVVQITHSGRLDVVCADAPVRVICEDLNAVVPDEAMWATTFGGSSAEDAPVRRVQPDLVRAHEQNLAAALTPPEDPA
ncbi:hypothetical protein LAJ19_20540 (plasmid) [Deinococcus taeanensis]|uniref:hypothetical protein n=1 Tax=Deinococcus taeanensis TaxID=2737050 RepID=UPI001CDCF3CA|nr:hypothetical protein [Deinococcus taeanensis]UBV45199.1 hypothetical protein LAJ19_20540 [Deinococcus taeanensis]